jgi:autonomous glycyl radical cofactor GrcA
MPAIGEILEEMVRPRSRAPVLTTRPSGYQHRFNECFGVHRYNARSSNGCNAGGLLEVQ